MYLFYCIADQPCNLSSMEPEETYHLQNSIKLLECIVVNLVSLEFLYHPYYWHLLLCFIPV